VQELLVTHGISIGTIGETDVPLHTHEPKPVEGRTDMSVSVEEIACEEDYD